MKLTERHISSRSLEIQAYVWLGLPMLLFLCGWMRWYISLPLCAALIWASVSRFTRRGGAAGDGCAAGVRLSRGYVAAVVIIPLLLLFLGMGGFVAQHWDYQWRNAVFFDLARRDWPVVYDAEVPRLLCYYIGFWLPSAVVSRLTGLIMPGDVAQLLWAWWGLAIGYSLLVARLGGRASWWILPLMLLTGFWDSAVLAFFREPLARLSGLPDSIYVYSYYMSFSLISQIRMIFNQTIPLWVALPLLYGARRDPGSLMLPASFLFLSSPLGCIGIAAAMLYWLARGGRRSLTFANAAGLAAVAATGLFYISNNNASATAPTSTLGPGGISLLCLVFLLSLGVYVPLVWNRMKGNVTFLLLLVTDVALPFLSLGSSDDLGRRAAIPMTIMLTYMLAAEVREWRSLRLWKKVALPAVMLVGMYDAWYMVDMTFREIDKFETRGFAPKLIYMMDHLDDPERNYHYDNFIAEGESFYTRHMMRRSHE